jgi:hypothetical protein
MNVDRGSGRISRADVMDGYAGESAGVMGSLGWSLGFQTEIHDVAGGVQYPYWAQLLLTAGHRGVYDGGSSTVTLTPTTREIVDWTSPTTADADPAAATLAVLNNRNDNGQDSYSVMYDAVGAATFNFAANQRATIDLAYVGRVADNVLYNTGTFDTMASGTCAQFSGSPFVCKSMNVILVDNESSQVVSTTALNNVTITTNTETPDVEDMTDAHGFALSPAFQNAGASVSFEVADGGGQFGTERYLMQNYQAGNRMRLVMGITGSGGRTLEFDIPKIQFDGVSFGETNGYSTWSCDGTATRATCGTDAPYSITWRFA